MRLRGVVVVISILILFFMGISIYAQVLARRLLQQQITLVHLYAAAIRFAAQAPEECLTDFFWEYIFPERQKGSRIFLLPLVLVGGQGKVLSHNFHELRLPVPRGQELEDFLPYLGADTTEFVPIQVEYGGGRFLRIYYGEPLILRQVRWMPIVSSGLLVMAGIIWVGFLYTAHRYRQDRLWVGLARETAHQLGTPLSGLMGSVDMLKENPELLSQFLPRMEEDLNRLEKIADRFSKIGRAPMLKPQPLLPVIEEVVAYFRQRLPANVRLEYEPPTERVILPFNSTLLQWVMENLLRNSLDALPPEGGTITVRVQPRRQTVRIEVQDTGKGISPSQWEEIFRPGFTTKAHGWGIGLALARRVIERYHGGEIYVAQSTPGQGTVIRIEIPYRQRISLLRRTWQSFSRRVRGILRLLRFTLV